jgi:hypothetical protein
MVVDVLERGTERKKERRERDGYSMVIGRLAHKS